MAWGNAAKVRFGAEIAGTSVYVAGHTAAAGSSGANELSGHGYSRGLLSASKMGSSSSTGTITTNADADIYTANDGSAQDIAYVTLWDAASGGNLLLYDDSDTITLAVPSNGQTVVLKSGTTFTI